MPAKRKKAPTTHKSFNELLKTDDIVAGEISSQTQYSFSVRPEAELTDKDGKEYPAGILQKFDLRILAKEYEDAIPAEVMAKVLCDTRESGGMVYVIRAYMPKIEATDVHPTHRTRVYQVYAVIVMDADNSEPKMIWECDAVPVASKVRSIREYSVRRIQETR